MIYINKFNLGSWIFKIRSEEVITDNELSKIGSELKLIYKNLNHNLSDSLISKFNLLKIDDILEVPNYFIEFIKLNKNLFHTYSEVFTPFSDFQEDLFICENNFIRKNVEFTIDSSSLRLPFLMDYLRKYLQSEIGLVSFLIQLNNFSSAFGSKKWILNSSLGPVILINRCMSEFELENEKKIIIFSNNHSKNILDFKKLKMLGNKKSFENYIVNNSLEIFTD